MQEITIPVKVLDDIQEKLLKLFEYRHGKLEITLIDGENIITDLTRREKIKIH